MKRKEAIQWSYAANNRIDFGRNSALCAFPVRGPSSGRNRRDCWGVCIGSRVAWTTDAADGMVTEYASW